MKSRGWTSQCFDLRILLVAVAIQGITPNAHNLASCRLLRILFWTATLDESNARRGEVGSTTCDLPHADSPPNGSSAPVETHRKKTPGVLCLPVRAGLQVGPRRHAGNPLRIESVSESPWISLIKSAKTCPPRIPTLAKQGTDLLHSLCRLTC